MLYRETLHNASYTYARRAQGGFMLRRWSQVACGDNLIALQDAIPYLLSPHTIWKIEDQTALNNIIIAKGTTASPTLAGME